MGVYKLIIKNKKDANWHALTSEINKYENYLKSWHLIMKLDNNIINYYLITNKNMPCELFNNSDFLMMETENIELYKTYTKGLYFYKTGSILDIINEITIKEKGIFKYLDITFSKLMPNKTVKKANIYVDKLGKIFKYEIILPEINTLLNINYENISSFKLASIPKYLNITKSIPYFSETNVDSLFKINSFPYFKDNYYLNIENYDFASHSLILGSSGSGKSKFISLFISTIYKNKKLHDKYKIVLIDPHADIEKEIGDIAKVYDFLNEYTSLDLFKMNTKDITAQSEIYLSLFKNLLSGFYNAKLERVLRYALHTLLTCKTFNFVSLKNLLTDLEYRTNLINTHKDILPESIIYFFLNDFNALKNTSYTECISPIISFIDELSLLPIFNNINNINELDKTINDNFLNIFSLNMNQIGIKATQTITSLIMGLMLNYIQNKNDDKHIIFIIDEASLVNNPLVPRFLSEARKYNLSLVLSLQYLSQFDEYTLDSIFANTLNYYIFKTSQKDSNLLNNNIDIKLENEKDKQDRINLLTNLEKRNALVRINKDGKLISPFLCTTCDFISSCAPREKSIIQNINKNDNNYELKDFNINTNVNLNDILKQNSTSRKVI